MRRTVFGREIYVPLDPYKASRRVETAILSRYLDVKPGERLLDIGCGTGYWTEWLAGPGRAAGIDLLGEDLSIAQTRHAGMRHAYLRANAERLPFADAAFDKIFGVCSVEHIPDNDAAFSEFHRCLKPGGVVALTLDALNYDAIPGAARAAHAVRYHVAHFYDADYARRMLESHGFAVTHLEYLICSPLSHALNLFGDRNRKFQYLLFPAAYPMMRLADRWLGRRDQGWKLAVRAVRA